MGREVKTREAWLDCLRAMAILLVIIGHVLGVNKTCESLHGIIYRFHMPLFFMLSGITHELFAGKNEVGEIRKRVVKRAVNLLVPASAFTLFTILLFPKNDIFFYYNTAWFLWFLAFILAITAIEDILILKGNSRLCNIAACLYVFLWLLFGVLQILLMRGDASLYWKFAKEISKFFGYLLCFKAGRWMICHKETVMKADKKAYAVLGVFLLAQIVGAIRKIEPDIALIRILYGILGAGGVIIFYYHLRKKCTLLEKIISKYSLEIYLIHSGILMRIASAVPFHKGSYLERTVWGAVLFLAFLLLPILIAYCEKYFSPLRLLFHPME